MHPDDQIKHFHLGYYNAPPDQSEVPPQTVLPNCEYIELITVGGVFFDAGNGENEKYYGPGTIFWHFPGEKTVHKYTPRKPYECLVAIFKITPRHERIAPRITRCIMMDPVQFADESLRAFHDDSFSRKLLAGNVHSRLLWEAYSHQHAEIRQDMPHILKDALKMIDYAYASDFTLKDISKKIGVSVPHLHMLFKKYLQESPHQRIMSRRLLEAKNRLAATDANLKTLAFECGFRNVEHFCRLFKQRFSMTPSEFRKRSAPYSRNN